MSEWTRHAERADKWFSRLIRLTHADDTLFCSCVTCGTRYHVSSIDAGHFVDRQVLSTRWLEQNVHPQCQRCNRFMGGAKLAYVRFLFRTYGAQVLGDLLAADEARNKFTPKLSLDDMEDLADFARDSCRKCADDKGVDLKLLNWR